MYHRKFSKQRISLVALCFSVAFPLIAHATVATEVSTAAEHAGFSAKSPDLKTAHMHLHHALNCLVGPKGKGYDSKELDPCKGQGNGAIPDSGNKKEKARLRKVVREVHKGLASNNLKTVKKDAARVEAKLKAMKIK